MLKKKPEKKSKKAALLKKARELKREGKDKSRRRLALFTQSVERFIEEEKIEGELGVNLRVLSNHNTILPVSLSAIAGLGDLADKRATPFLTSYLKLIDIRCKNYPEFKNFFKRNIAEALGEIKDKRSVPTLLALLKDRTDREARNHAIQAFSRIRDKRAIEPMLSIALNKREGSDHRHNALVALGNLAFVLVEGNPKAEARLKVAKAKSRRLFTIQRSFLLYHLASDPLILRRVPADPKAKAGEFAYLNNLIEELKGEKRTFSELIDILRASLKKGKK